MSRLDSFSNVFTFQSIKRNAKDTDIVHMEPWVWGIRENAVAPRKAQVLQGGRRHNGQEFFLHIIYECSQDKSRIPIYLDIKIRMCRRRMFRLSKRVGGHVTVMVILLNSKQQWNKLAS